MIFATVGTQLPFDRLLAGLNNWAARNPVVPVFAQTGASQRKFDHIDTVEHLSQSEFATRFSAARLIVSHAGMGTILSAAELGKPLILMPRRLKFGEHRTDHQQDTATEMAHLSNVTVVADGEALHEALDRALVQGFPVAKSEADTVSPKLEPLLNVIRDFVWEQPTAQRGA
ncbi:glycosyltransferase [Tropicibacter sp. Alg240-R139]|uniref:glycosyltransferase n=1 Tax=Tropicibacter sp. Alg240-R139 TaxID=2305991 RepID=UPI0013DF652F|nr:glycosyltransferase [Tropicibacter sp. Alg240-R139]